MNDWPPDCAKLTLDYADHAIYSSEEIRARLKQLEIDGIALNDGTGWRYNTIHSQNDQSFIF